MSLITTSNPPGRAGHLLEISAKTESLSVKDKLCLDLTPGTRVTNDPNEWLPPRPLHTSRQGPRLQSQ